MNWIKIKFICKLTHCYIITSQTKSSKLSSKIKKYNTISNFNWKDRITKDWSPWQLMGLHHDKCIYNFRVYDIPFPSLSKKRKKERDATRLMCHVVFIVQLFQLLGQHGSKWISIRMKGNRQQKKKVKLPTRISKTIWMNHAHISFPN